MYYFSKKVHASISTLKKRREERHEIPPPNNPPRYSWLKDPPLNPATLHKTKIVSKLIIQIIFNQCFKH